MRKGFTLIELLLVIAVISILAVSYSSLGTGFLVRGSTQNSINDLSSSFRVAQLNSMFGKRDSTWGVRVQSNQIILFSGTTYATRNPTYDEIITHPMTVTVSPNNSEVVFAKNTGTTSPVTYTVSNNLGESTSLSINQQGTLDVN